MRQLAISILVVLNCGQSYAAVLKQLSTQERRPTVSKAQKLFKQEKLSKSLEAEQLALSLKNKQSVSNVSWPKQERPFFAKLLELQMSRQWTDFIVGSQTFIRKYPYSPFADNILFMRGMAYVGLGKFGEAIRDFEKIEKAYPSSNKTPAALFAKGVAYKKLGVKESASDVFKRIMKNYPGTTENDRARNELRLLSVNLKTLQKKQR